MIKCLHEHCQSVAGDNGLCIPCARWDRELSTPLTLICPCESARPVNQSGKD